MDGNGHLQTLPAWGMMIGYRHFWHDSLRSEVTYGYVELENRAEQGSKAYDHTHYAQANLIWSPLAQLSIGLEYLYGSKTTGDGSDGDDHRGQLSFHYKLF